MTQRSKTHPLSCHGSTTILCRSMNCEPCKRLRKFQERERRALAKKAELEREHLLKAEGLSVPTTGLESDTLNSNENSEPIEQAALPRPLDEKGLREGAEMHVQNLLGWKAAPLEDGDETQQRYFNVEGTEEWVADGEASEFETNAYHFLVDAYVSIQKLEQEKFAAPAAIEQARPQPPTLCRFCGKPESDELHQADEGLLKHSSFAKDDYHDFADAPDWEKKLAAAAEPAPERTQPQSAIKHDKIIVCGSCQYSTDIFNRDGICDRCIRAKEFWQYLEKNSAEVAKFPGWLTGRTEAAE